MNKYGLSISRRRLAGKWISEDSADTVPILYGFKNKINSSIALQKQLTQTKLKTGSRENLENVSKKYNIYINYHGL